MPYITSIERFGIQKGLLEGIESCLKVKFGAAGKELMPEISEIRDHVLLSKILKRIVKADSPDQVRRSVKRYSRPKGAEPM